MYNICTNNITDMPVSEIFYQFYPQGLLYAYENNICLFITEPALGNFVSLNININSSICLNLCHMKDK